MATSYVEEGIKDGLGSTAEFRIEVVTSSGSYVLVRDKVEWQEAGTEEIDTTYPSCVTFHEQRLWLGNFTHDPQLLRTSQIGDIYNFDRSEPLRDDDAMDLVVATTRMAEIRSLIPLDALLIFTASSEHYMRGAEGLAVTPTAVDSKPMSHHGATWVEPLVVGSRALFVRRGGRAVEETQFSPAENVEPRDLSILARHLFETKHITSWCVVDSPNQVVWAARSDGKLVALTYVPEQGVFAWHQHDVGGDVEWVESSPSTESGQNSELWADFSFAVIIGTAKKYCGTYRFSTYR